MPSKIVFFFNSNGPGGWSETYYTSTSTVGGALADAANLASVRAPMLNGESYIFGWRAGVLGQPGQSQLVLTSPATAGTTDPADSDLISTGLQYQMHGGGKTITRILRGIPDSWAVWNVAVQRMITTALAARPFTNFVNALRGLGAGWPSALKKGAGLTSTQPITAIAANAFGQLLLTVASTANYGIINGSPIALSGFKGLAGKLNGTYGPNAYAVASGTTLLVNRQVSAGQVAAFASGTSFVRLTNAPTNFITATTIDTQNKVAKHNVGRGFGATRGRRSGKR